jgi:hypothetical protein
MGQQQLLLLVMGIRIVGIALLIGVQTFGENKHRVNADTLMLRSIRIANKAQQWLLTPSAMGGGRPESGASNFSGLTLDLKILGYKVDADNKYSDINGIYSADISGSAFVIEARSIPVSGRPDNVICVRVDGLDKDNITTDVNPEGGSCT